MPAAPESPRLLASELSQALFPAPRGAWPAPSRRSLCRSSSRCVISPVWRNAHTAADMRGCRLKLVTVQTVPDRGILRARVAMRLPGPARIPAAPRPAPARPHRQVPPAPGQRCRRRHATAAAAARPDRRHHPGPSRSRPRHRHHRAVTAAPGPIPRPRAPARLRPPPRPQDPRRRRRAVVGTQPGRRRVHPSRCPARR
jgi:hypothetical protein